MKKYLLLFIPCALFLVPCALSQNVGIGTNNPLNKLHVAGGFRLDTLTGVGGNGLLTHDPNGVVYGIKFTGNITDVLRGDGTFGSGGSGSVGWSLNGNSGTDPANNFIGTTDDQPLLFRVNNEWAGEIGLTSSGNIFLGNSSGKKTTPSFDGINNTAIGFQSLFDNNTGFENTAVGYGALYANTTGYGNTAMGVVSLLRNTTGSKNVALGPAALRSNTEGHSNVAIGARALFSNHTSSNLVAVGDSALYNNDIGQDNTAIGSKALYSNVSGTGNSALGDGALFKNTLGVNNNAFGLASLGNNIQGSNNSAFGSFVLEHNTGDFNSAFGGNALNNNSTGYNNTAVGLSAMYNNTAGQGNVAIGYQALYTNTTGDVNTAIGAQADVIFGNQINTTLIGHFAKASSSNKVRIGNAAVTVIEGQVAYTYPSDGRFKTNVSEDIKGLDFIMKLKPVSYNFQTKKYEAFMNGGVENAKAFSKLDFTESENLRHNGFVAQEVEKAAKDAGYNFDGIITPKNDRDTYGLSYSQFVVPLVKAVQEQQAIIEKQQKQIDNLLKRVEALEKK